MTVGKPIPIDKRKKPLNPGLSMEVFLTSKQTLIPCDCSFSRLISYDNYPLHDNTKNKTKTIQGSDNTRLCGLFWYKYLRCRQDIASGSVLSLGLLEWMCTRNFVTLVNTTALQKSKILRLWPIFPSHEIAAAFASIKKLRVLYR